MRGFTAAVLCFALLACGKPTKRIDIVLVNSTGMTIKVRAKAGLFGRTIKLTPGMTWTGWLPAGMSAKDIRIEIKK